LTPAEKIWVVDLCTDSCGKTKAQGSKRKEKGPEHKAFDQWKSMIVIFKTAGDFVQKSG
jgi:hypothetical protein